MQTLLLNASCEPMKVISWQRAVCMWLDRKVEILEEYTERVYHAIDDWSGKMPAVVRLIKYIHGTRDKVKFSRINVFSRDFFTCQYCSDQPGTFSLTYDHVVPRSRGGKTEWANIVTCCLDCNAEKGDHIPEEVGMQLTKQPIKPHKRPQLRFALSTPNTPDEWRSWLYWEIELQT